MEAANFALLKILYALVPFFQGGMLFSFFKISPTTGTSPDEENGYRQIG
jgi:hypothetical protein